MKGTLLIGSLPRIVTPVARCLHARGIPVHTASAGRGRSAGSRAIRSFTPIDQDENDPGVFFDGLRETIARYDIDTVMPCGDEALQAIAPHDEALRRIVHYCAPSPAACRKILAKRETLGIALAVGVPVPTDYTIPDAAALAGMRDAIRFPVVVKPRHRDWEAITDIKSEMVRNYEDLSRHFERFPEFGNGFLIQEYIPGYGVAIEILMDHANPIAVFQHRRLREYPVRGGVSVAAISERPDPEIFQHAVALLRAIEWQGVAMVEFRKDSASARLGLMEVNGRYWGSVALSLYCGMEFPYYAWQLAHGEQPHPPAAYKTGKRFRWLAGDVKRLYECLVSRELSGMRAAADILRDIPAARDAMWSWQDPFPAIKELGFALGAVGLMAGGKAAGRLFTGPAYRRLKALRRTGPARVVRYLERRFVSRPGRVIEPRRPVRSLVFICHGNIIRSPMAEAVFRAAAAPGIRVESAGTTAVPHRNVDARAAKVAEEFGVSLNGHTAKRVSAETVAGADLLVVMDYLNYVGLEEAFPEANRKTILLGSDRRGVTEIDDPYEGTLDDIRSAFGKIELYTRALVERIRILEIGT